MTCFCGNPDRPGVAHRSNACLVIGIQPVEYPFPCGFDPMTNLSACGECDPCKRAIEIVRLRNAMADVRGTGEGDA